MKALAPEDVVSHSPLKPDTRKTPAAALTIWLSWRSSLISGRNSASSRRLGRARARQVGRKWRLDTHEVVGKPPKED